MPSATSSSIVSPASKERLMYKGVGPDHALAKAAKDLLLHTLVLDVDKAACIRAVVIDHSAA
jgi:hypothetical protein